MLEITPQQCDNTLDALQRIVSRMVERHPDDAELRHQLDLLNGYRSKNFYGKELVPVSTKELVDALLARREKCRNHLDWRFEFACQLSRLLAVYQLDNANYRAPLWAPLPKPTLKERIKAAIRIFFS